MRGASGRAAGERGARVHAMRRDQLVNRIADLSIKSRLYASHFMGDIVQLTT